MLHESHFINSANPNVIKIVSDKVHFISNRISTSAIELLRHQTAELRFRGSVLKDTQNLVCLIYVVPAARLNELVNVYRILIVHSGENMLHLGRVLSNSRE